MVSVMSASHYITSASRYHLRYQSRSSMYICGLIPRNFAELAEAVKIGSMLFSNKTVYLHNNINPAALLRVIRNNIISNFIL